MKNKHTNDQLMSQVRYLADLLRFAFRANPLLYASVVLSLVSVGVELLAMTTLIPLSTLAIGKELTADSFPVGLMEYFVGPLNARTLLLLFSGLLVIRLLTQLTAQGLSILLGRRIHAQLSSLAFSEIIERVSIEDVERRSIGFYITLAGDESFRASSLVTLITLFLSSAVLGLLYFILILRYSPLLGLFVSVFLFVSLLSLWGAFKKSLALGAKQIEQSQLAGSIFIDALNGLRGVRAFVAESHVRRQYKEEVDRYVRTLFLVDFINLVAKLVPAIILVGLLALIVGFGSQYVATHIDLAVMLASIAFLMRLFPVAGQILSVFLRIYADARAGRDVLAAIAIPETYGKEATARIGRAIDEITLRNVSFTHLDGKNLLTKFNLVLKRGKSYALSGPSGTGKSTLIDLLLGFYRPQSGEILVNGVEMRKVDLKDLRHHVLALGQQVVIFNDTVGNNIRFGADASNEAVVRAARLACIDEVIENLPEGYETRLNYRGTNLSGGQVQRIGLARALLRNPDVLILDESTSALDKQTRDRVVENIMGLFKDRILIFATHDKDVMSRIDEIIDLQQMSIVNPSERQIRNASLEQ